MLAKTKEGGKFSKKKRKPGRGSGAGNLSYQNRINNEEHRNNKSYH